jgi:hypothetical protein
MGVMVIGVTVTGARTVLRARQIFESTGKYKCVEIDKAVVSFYQATENIQTVNYKKYRRKRSGCVLLGWIKHD